MKKDKFKKVLKEQGKDQAYLATLLNITYQSVSIKINGHKDFTLSELLKIYVDLDLTPQEFVDIFFKFEEEQ